MNIIFLDIDGVLNCSSFRLEMFRRGDYSVGIEAHLIARLKRIVNETGAAIVLISSWRKFWMHNGSVDNAGKRIETAFASAGLIIRDKTPVLHGGSRSQEIEQWLNNKPYVEHYVILDDNDFAWSRVLRRHWVCCPDDTGLTDSLADIAIQILNGDLLPIKKSDLFPARGIRGRLRKWLTIFQR